MPARGRHDAEWTLAAALALAYIALTLLHRQVKEAAEQALRGSMKRMYERCALADIAVLTDLIEPEARALGFALVRVKMFGGPKAKGGDRTLQIMAERPDTRQLTIDDCAELSRRVSDRFDALEGTPADPFEDEYRLEVSSPGIDRPLTRLQDYADWAGHEARITLAEKIDGRKQFKGDLNGADDGIVSIVAPDGTVHRLPFDRIEDAKLTITDRLIAATRPLSTEGADDVIELSAAADGEDEPAEQAEAEETN